MPKTTNEIFKDADSIPDDVRFDEIHEKYLDAFWYSQSEVDSLRQKLKEELQILYTLGIEPLEYKRLNMSMKIQIDKIFNELSQSNPKPKCVCPACSGLMYSSDNDEIHKVSCHVCNSQSNPEVNIRSNPLSKVGVDKVSNPELINGSKDIKNSKGNDTLNNAKKWENRRK